MQTIVGGIAAFLLAALMGVGAVALYIFSLEHPLDTESCIEIGQESLLFLSVLGFTRAAMVCRDGVRGGLILIAAFTACLFIRELDAYFDMIVHGFWKYIAMAFLVYVFTLLRRCDFTTIIPGIAYFIRQRAFMMMLPGTAMLLVYSRIYGYKGLWQLYFGAYDNWTAMKTFSEETTELVAYALIFGAALVLWLDETRKSRRAEIAADKAPTA